jgi:NADPH:quinone reductase
VASLPRSPKLHRRTLFSQDSGSGVGHVAIQIANAFGAKVFATGSAKSLAYIASLHAVPIDRERQAVEDYVAEHTQGEGSDIVYDTVGGAMLDASPLAMTNDTHDAIEAGHSDGKVVIDADRN